MAKGHDKFLTSASKRPHLHRFSLQVLKIPCAQAHFKAMNSIGLNYFVAKINFSLYQGSKQAYFKLFLQFVFNLKDFTIFLISLISRSKMRFLLCYSAVSALLRFVLWALIAPICRQLLWKILLENSNSFERYHQFCGFLKKIKNGLQLRPF